MTWTTGYWVKIGIRDKELHSLFKVDDNLKCYQWSSEQEKFVPWERDMPKFGWDDDWDKVTEDEVLKLLNRTSWENK